ncbi:E3 14.7k-like protein [Human adenovirus 31]|uniref:E3 control protein 14.7 kDa n=2 Tax=Human mastadenovirus A TaxID=129875 RepID=T1UGA8_9ADEN|nr:E3 control protein 14.7 kDa [Human mastadenovirus A]UNA48352.1 E3 14.7k-like protein [Human adenovirus 31]UNA48964.1 E3 14.7k-like protein [Human adenovirus 31]UNB10724.1 E3 control protein 14.7 kDa [Human mastadenovirus A]UNB11120.1 E3 control protein 14.7 kDa [Human mastadenovirus A]
MIEPDLQMDGTMTEQRLLADRARRRQQDQKNKELLDLQTVHQCKKGLFCLVKQATLRYENLPGKEHQLCYTLPTQRQSFTAVVGSVPIKVSQQAGQQEGSICCLCTSPECLYTLIKTLCGIRKLLPMN